MPESIEGRAKILKVNTDNFQNLAAGYKVSSIPALFLFKNGQVVENFVGLQSAAVLAAAIDRALG